MPRMPSLLAVSIAAVLSATPALATTPAEDGPLITPEERQAHEERMRKMSPAEREAYRNEQYEMYREQAKARGLELPASPPWPTAAPATGTQAGPSPAPAAPAPAAPVAAPSRAGTAAGPAPGKSQATSAW